MKTSSRTSPIEKCLQASLELEKETTQPEGEPKLERKTALLYPLWFPASPDPFALWKNHPASNSARPIST